MMFIRNENGKLRFSKLEFELMIANLIVTDAKDDKSVEYAKAVIDRRILSIVGEDLFVEFDERYGIR